MNFLRQVSSGTRPAVIPAATPAPPSGGISENHRRAPSGWSYSGIKSTHLI
jgi:hypothetical protein